MTATAPRAIYRALREAVASGRVTAKSDVYDGFWCTFILYG